MKNICVIPARMGSSRFPGKPLAGILGLPLVLHVLERCRLCADLDRVVVATCDDEIRHAVETHGGEVVMTDPDHPGCVDRTDETIDLVGTDLSDDDFVLMVQGDEILVTPDALSRMITAYEQSEAKVVNLVSPILNDADHDDPNCVKVVGSKSGRALFFSRSPIPSRYRLAAGETAPVFQQTGVIGFQKAFLRRFGALERTPLEVVEGIDMLRVIENDLPIMLVHMDRETLGVDTPEDLRRAEDILKTDAVAQRYLGGHDL